MRTALTLSILVASVSFGELIPEENPLFQTETVQEIHLYFQQEDFWQIMENNYETETYLEGEFQWEGYHLYDVGVRFKGNSSYMFNPSMKKSFKVDFNVFVEDQELLGVSKINLNCNYDDPSFVREAAAYELCREIGLPCPRTSFAALYINDVYWGLYTLVEQFDGTFIEERFGESEDGNLWKGDNHGSLEFKGWEQEDYYEDYELKTNEEENDWTALVNLTEVISGTPADSVPEAFSDEMDVYTALCLLATDNLMVNLDSYAGRCANYYLYHADRDGRFVFGQWDVNEAWGCFNSWGYSIEQLQSMDIHWTNIEPDENRPLADVLWSIPEYDDVYRGILLRMDALYANPSILIPRMEEMRDLIRDWVYMEDFPRSLFSPEQFEEAMYTDVPIGPGRFAPALGTFIENRHEYLVSVLGTWDPVENIILNELMAGNDSTIADENGGYDDWIEIVNTGTEPVDLSSFGLTDDMAFPGKYTFPDTVIQPGEYMLVWADKEPEQGALHAEFKLDGDGEEVYLMQGSVMVDHITFPDLSDDDSWGRWPDLEENWAVQAYPTPGAPNTDTPPDEGGWEAGSTLSILCPNPVKYGSADVVLTGISGTAELDFFDVSGRKISTPFQGELSGESTVTLETEQLPSGVYVLRLAQGGSVTSRLVTIIN